MEQTASTGNSKWGLAARDGLILAAVTVVVSTLTFLTESTFLGMLLWAVKLGGSIWLLSVIMKRYGNTHPDESTFSYGVIVCLLSAIVCAVWAFIEYQFLFPDAVAEAFEQTFSTFDQLGSLPEEVTDMLLKMQDNYAQISCITTFFWCTLLGILFSAIISNVQKRQRGVFTDEEMKSGDDEFNF